MLARLASLRLWLLAAMIVSAAAGLAAAAALFKQVEHAHEQADARTENRQEARAIAAQVEAGAGRARLAALQSVMGDDRMVVMRDGHTIFQGPLPPGAKMESSVQVSIPGGVVRVGDSSSGEGSITLELALITAGVLALVITVAVLTATLVTRAVRVPVQRAIDASERISHGDLSTRMGVSGPEELVKLGRAFDEMAARLEGADRDQRQFLADVAHEIATPVNAVAGFALALADGAAEEPHQREEARIEIEGQVARLRDLLTDLRELTRLDLAGEAKPVPVALDAWAEKLVAGFRQAASNAGIELALAAPRGRAITDPRLLEMIGANLLSNALRYTPTGGRVDVRLHRQRDKLVLSVKDSGAGIAPEHQRRIFERLYRVDSTRDRATGGSGLGLAIAARAAAALGGHIEVDSAPGRGSCFRLVAPLARSREPALEGEPAAAR